jgi:dipeptidyl-peptidase-4
MDRPQDNPDGYAKSRVIDRVGNYKGDATNMLRITHGTGDDNVHFQNSAEYAETLVQKGKQFDMQVYTNRNHSIAGGNTRQHLYTKITNFFNQQLKK